MSTEREPLTPRANAVLQSLHDMHKAFADEDVPGWILSKPSPEEISSDLAVLSARSKPEEHAPFVLPDDAEASIAVIEGSIRIDAGRQSFTMVGRHFSVVTAGPGRTIVALEPLTRIYCIYFRARANGDGRPEVHS